MFYCCTSEYYLIQQNVCLGGGWQDQVGGVCPGFNVGTSPQDPFVSKPLLICNHPLYANTSAVYMLLVQNI